MLGFSSIYISYNEVAIATPRVTTCLSLKVSFEIYLNVFQSVSMKIPDAHIVSFLDLTSPVSVTLRCYPICFRRCLHFS